MRLVSWNCRGLGNPSKAEAIKDLLKIEPSDIIMLQEMKIEGKDLLDTSKMKWKKKGRKSSQLKRLIRRTRNPLVRRTLPAEQISQDPALDLHGINA